MGNTIKRDIGKPSENTGRHIGEAIIVRGSIRVPGCDFDRRPEVGPAPTYLGPSKVESRSSAIGVGNGQSKKHKSEGKGQY